MNVILDEAKKILNFNIASFINNKGFETAVKSRINSINEKKGIDGNQELLLDVFENEIIKILEKTNRTNQETQILNWTRNVYINNLRNYGPIFICSRLLRKPYYEKLFKEDKSTISFSIDKDKFNIGDKYSKFTSLGYYSNNSDYTIKYDSIIVDTIYKNGKAYLLATLYCPNKTGCKYEDSILMKANLYNNSSVTVNDKINYNMSYDAVVKVLNKPIGVLNQDSSYYVWATGKNVGDKYIFIKFSYGLFSYGISEIRVGTWWYKGEFEHVVKEGVPNEK